MGHQARFPLWMLAILIGLSVLMNYSPRMGRDTLRGVVLSADADVRKQMPLANVQISAEDSKGVQVVQSDFSGSFTLHLAAHEPDRKITLRFRRPDYEPLDVIWPGEGLDVVRMKPVVSKATSPDVAIANVSIRYSIAAATLANIGNGTQLFEVRNTGNVACQSGHPCSPDHRWAAAIGSASLDAGEGNEFRNARVSCIAGPCPFTRIQSDGFSKGGRYISVAVLNWSDTATFVLQGEVYRQEVGNTVRSYRPLTLGRALLFSLPESAEGPSIEAELNGEPIVFPLAPTPYLSWADCVVRVEKDRSRDYRCELKPSYIFQ